LQTGWGLTEHLVFDLRMVENFFEFFFFKKKRRNLERNFGEIMYLS
jgi:hypothetical protein